MLIVIIAWPTVAQLDVAVRDRRWVAAARAVRGHHRSSASNEGGPLKTVSFWCGMHRMQAGLDDDPPHTSPGSARCQRPDFARTFTRESALIRLPCSVSPLPSTRLFLSGLRTPRATLPDDVGPLLDPDPVLVLDISPSAHSIPGGPCAEQPPDALPRFFDLRKRQRPAWIQSLQRPVPSF